MSIASPYSKLLIPDEPLQVLPTLALAIGLNEAVVLQQLHYWMNPRRNMGTIYNGRRWIYNTYKEWQENFPFWSTRTIQRIIAKLESDGLIEGTDEFNTDARDRTKWYTINYEHPILDDGLDNLSSSKSRTDCHGGLDKLALSTTKQRIHTETTAETIPTSDAESEYQDALFNRWYDAYPRKAGKADARKAFARAIKTVPLTRLTDAIEQHKKSDQWIRDGGKFIPYPATWLNRGSWDDELPAGDSQAHLPVNMRVNNDRDATDEEWLGSYAKRGAG